MKNALSQHASKEGRRWSIAIRNNCNSTFGNCICCCCDQSSSYMRLWKTSPGALSMHATGLKLDPSSKCKYLQPTRTFCTLSYRWRFYKRVQKHIYYTDPCTDLYTYVYRDLLNHVLRIYIAHVCRVFCRLNSILTEAHLSLFLRLQLQRPQ